MNAANDPKAHRGKVDAMQRLLTVVCLLAFGAEMYGQNTPRAIAHDFAGNYSSLKPEHRVHCVDP